MKAQDEIASQRWSVLIQDEVAAIVDELKRTRGMDDMAELGNTSAMLVQQVTITGREYEAA